MPQGSGSGLTINPQGWRSQPVNTPLFERLKMSEALKQEAVAYIETIMEMMELHEAIESGRLEELRQAKEWEDDKEEGDDEVYLSEDDDTELTRLENLASQWGGDEEQVSEAINNHPLEIEYRSGWCSSPDGMEAGEIRITLTTGGPTVYLQGEYNGGTCSRIYLHYSHGSEYVDYWPKGDERTAVEAFCEMVAGE